MRRDIMELLGPIFAKEILEIARRWRYYLCRTAYGVILLFVLAVAYEEFQAAAGRMGLSNALARLAEVVFSAASYVQYWSVYLLVPAFLCGVVAGEREERTLELLFITPLTDREIVLGKLFSRVAAMACLILCGVPVISLLMLFGGISPESVWRVLAASFLAMFFTGSHAVYFSVIARGPMEALARTYISLFFWLAGLPLLAWGLREVYQSMPTTLSAEAAEQLSHLLLIYPLVSFWGAVNENYHGTLAFSYGVWAWPVSFVFPAVWSMFVLWRAVRRLRETPQLRLPWTRWLPWHKRLQRKALQPKLVAARRARAATRWSGEPIANPLWLRARLTHVYDRVGSVARIRWLGWSVALFALAMLAYYDPRSLANTPFSIVFQAPSWAIVMLVTALTTGHSLVGDRRRGFLEQVIVTPLTGAEIIDGTFLAMWEHLRQLIWLPLALALLFCLTEASSALGTIVSLVTGLLFCTVLIWHGIACSLAARTSAGGVVGTFVLPFAVIIGVPMTAVGYRQDHGPILWVIIGVGFVVTWCWAWQKLNAASVCGYLTALHLVLVGAAVFWTYSNPRGEYPMSAMNPIFLIVTPLMHDRQGGYDDVWNRQWPGIISCYWTALALNIVLIRYWLVRHFDRLVERTTLTSPPKPRPRVD